MRLGAATPAIITGGASGLGAATARRLRAAGVPVFLFDIDAARGAALAGEIGAGFAAMDVTRDDSVAAGLARARAAQGVERLCVNCAGIAPSARIAGPRGGHDMGLFERVIATNLVGTARVMAGSAAAMIAAEPLPGADGERGLVVNTASIAAFEGQVGQAAYAAAKGGVAALCLPAARDLAARGVRVMTLAPGLFDTAMLAALPAAVRARLAADVPAPARLGDPDEFAAMVCFLAQTTYLNGETIRIDGALRMGPR